MCELFDRVAELGKGAGSQQLGDLEFSHAGLAVDDPFKSTSFGGESYEAGASVRGIDFPGDVTARFEVAEQVVHRLTGDLQLLREF